MVTRPLVDILEQIQRRGYRPGVQISCTVTPGRPPGAPADASGCHSRPSSPSNTSARGLLEGTPHTRRGKSQRPVFLTWRAKHERDPSSLHHDVGMRLGGGLGTRAWLAPLFVRCLLAHANRCSDLRPGRPVGHQPSRDVGDEVRQLALHVDQVGKLLQLTVVQAVSRRGHGAPHEGNVLGVTPVRSVARHSVKLPLTFSPRQALPDDCDTHASGVAG